MVTHSVVNPAHQDYNNIAQQLLFGFGKTVCLSFNIPPDFYLDEKIVQFVK